MRLKLYALATDDNGGTHGVLAAQNRQEGAA